MDNLVFSLNATVPIFLMMILGLFFNKIGWMDEEFANKMSNSSSGYHCRYYYSAIWRS